MNCDRCGASITFWRVSMFNTENCCSECLAKEQAHPLYPKACAIEHENVLAGNYNFPGIGLPEDLRKDTKKE